MQRAKLVTSYLLEEIFAENPSRGSRNSAESVRNRLGLFHNSILIDPQLSLSVDKEQKRSVPTRDIFVSLRKRLPILSVIKWRSFANQHV